MSLATTTLSVLHITVGASALLAPSFTAAFFGLVPAASSLFVTRLFGSRDLALGLAVWATSGAAGTRDRDRPAAGSRTKNERRGALWIANLVNAIDIVSCVWSYYEGSINTAGVLWGAPGAAFLLLLGVVGIRDVDTM
ncbi:hypothetical protein RHOSPDRAFT_32228 [Rhodotorula sp. JG-1b]|nr:hypothetical protein RHOSPDRAFT_32228 [Rhodotorula sp. JG-1b]